MARWTISTRWIPLAIALAVPAAVLADNNATDTKHGYLGIRMQQIEGGLADALGMKEGAGVLVGQVMEGSPAAKAGLEEGDIIVKVDGSPVGTPGELRALIRDKETGEAVKVEVLREKKSKTVAVTLGEAEDEGTEVFAPMPPHRPEWSSEEAEDDDDDDDDDRTFMFRTPVGEGDRKHGYLGVMTQPLSKELGEFFGVAGEGALVSEVIEESPAAKLGLRAGDVITRVDGVPVDGPGELARAVRKIAEAKEVDVEYVRDKRVRTGKVAIEIREGRGPGTMARRQLGNKHDFPRRFERYMPRGLPKMDDDVQAEVDALRNELEALRNELRKMQEQGK